jgi:hypothetical protein
VRVRVRVRVREGESVSKTRFVLPRLLIRFTATTERLDIVL